MTFTTIHIIYNPHSKGPGKKLARQLQRELFTKHSLHSHIHATAHAGHGEEIAYDLSKKDAHPLLISVSGDGGYHDVINGALKAQQEGASPFCAVMPAGNANDHARVVYSSELLSSIVRGNTRAIDIIKLTCTNELETKQRYAHSYIGFGLSPAIAVELNKTDLNVIKEIFIVAKNIFANRSFTIRHDKKDIALDSLVFSNIGEMAKILKLSKKALPDDGLFEVNIFPHRGKSYLLRRLWRATRGVEQARQLKSFQFTLVNTTVAQLDGEVLLIDAGSKIQIEVEHKRLQTLA